MLHNFRIQAKFYWKSVFFGKIVVFDLKLTQNLKTHSNFWKPTHIFGEQFQGKERLWRTKLQIIQIWSGSCRGVNSKHHAAERLDLEFGFQTPRKNFKTRWKIWKNFGEFCNFSVVFEPNSKSHISAVWWLLWYIEYLKCSRKKIFIVVCLFVLSLWKLSLFLPPFLNYLIVWAPPPCSIVENIFG